jgi:hypothetical protein
MSPTAFLSWIDNTRGPDRREVVFTPELADTILSTRMLDNQRRCYTRRAAEYARAMMDGVWRSDVTDVLFSVDGKLLDGQHRLAGVSMAGKEISLNVRRRVDPAIMTLIDTGRARTLGDHLRVGGYTSPRRLASLVRGAMTWDKAKANGGWPLSTKYNPCRPDEAFRFLEERLYANEAHEAVTCKQGRRLYRESEVMLLHFVLLELWAPKAREFFQLLYRGADLPTGSPLLALRDKLLTIRSERLRPFDRLYLTCKAWNYWVEGQTVKRMQMPPEKIKGRPFPWPTKPARGKQD